MIKIAFSMAWFPVTMGRYFLEALERRDDVELWTIGPFTGNYIPWNYGMTLPDKYVKQPNIALPPNLFNTHPRFDINLPWTPDLFLMLDAGFSFSSRVPGKIVARVQTDPHVLKFFYMQNKLDIDYDFCMQTPYMQEGEIYLPYAYDPMVHYPMNLPKEYDACLIGLQYPQRTALVEKLRHMGLKVFYETGKVYDEYREIYNKSRVALSWSTLQDLPCRVWEALAMRLPLVANHVPDMNKFFVDGIDYLGFDNVDEGARKVKELIDNPEQLSTIAENGYNAVLPHTWDARVEEILKTVGLL